jgi:predicted glutamine amidotransferase
MCRLFGMHAGPTALPATFWLLDAPDSLVAQSHHNPDGVGIGCFGADGAPIVDKQPLAAWQDANFAIAARELLGTTFVAHVRYASTGGQTVANTHPFLADGRLFAHNGVVQGLDRLDSRLTKLGAQVRIGGETDSERVFALIIAEIERNDSDTTAGLTVAVNWIGENLPVYALNIVLATATDLWALRYPETHELYVLERPPGGTGTTGHLEARSARINARSEVLVDRPAVIVASERMDDDRGWRLLQPGELLHVDANLGSTSSTPFVTPRHRLGLSQLDPTAAVSQRPDTRRGSRPRSSAP